MLIDFKDKDTRQRMLDEFGPAAAAVRPLASGLGSTHLMVIRRAILDPEGGKSWYLADGQEVERSIDTLSREAHICITAGIHHPETGHPYRYSDIATLRRIHSHLKAYYRSESK